MTTLEEINKELASRVMPDIEYMSLLNTKVEILQALADRRLAAIKRAEQTLHNLGANLPEGDLRQIASNEAMNLWREINDNA